MTGLVTRALEQRGATTLTVRGNSMAPTICDGAQVRLEHRDFAFVMPGQIVAVQTPSGIVVHRVRYRTALGLLLAGDNNVTLDASAPRETYVGVVTASRDATGHWAILEPFITTSRAVGKLEVLLPEAWLSLLDGAEPNFQSFHLHGIDEVQHAENAPDASSSIGVSPFGLEDDHWFVAQLASGAKRLLCLASFSVPGMARTPVNQVRGVARLSVFDGLQLESERGLREFLAFLDGMVSCALLSGRQR